MLLGTAPVLAALCVRKRRTALLAWSVTVLMLLPTGIALRIHGTALLLLIGPLLGIPGLLLATLPTLGLLRGFVLLTLITHR